MEFYHLYGKPKLIKHQLLSREAERHGKNGEEEKREEDRQGAKAREGDRLPRSGSTCRPARRVCTGGTPMAAISPGS